jgi:acetylornithine deacetylase
MQTLEHEFLDKLKLLIGTPSVSSFHESLDMGNLDIIHLLANWYEEAGFVSQILPLDGFDNKANLLATLGTGDGGLLLSGHTDTVPYDDTGWHSDPFTLHLKDDKLFGLGTTDMKSFLLLALLAVKSFDKNAFKRPLRIVATADEESSMAGAKALKAQGLPIADCAIIGEPTNLEPIRMHKGIFMEKIILKGQSGHSSDPANGNNALEGMRLVLNELVAFRGELQNKYHHDGFIVPVPTLNLGHVHGGDNPNRICAECECSFDLRPLPGMSINNLRTELYARVRQAVKHTGLSVTFKPLFDGIPAMETKADADIVRFLEKQTGITAQSVAFGTEAPYLAELGMDVVVMGPGDIALAHQNNEYLHTDYIHKTIKLLKNTIAHYCL